MSSCCLQKQLVNALDDEYMKPFCNHLTNFITASIPDILAYLFHSYGKVTSDQLKVEEIYYRQSKVKTIFLKISTQKIVSALLRGFSDFAAKYNNRD